MKVEGFITRRRCCGKSLAFADILIEDEAEDDKNKEKKLQIKFQRDSPLWDIRATNFPKKNSQLPYGAKISVDVEVYDEKWIVKAWETLSNPREEALELAKQNQTDGISCSKYLKSRSNAFLKYNNETKKLEPRTKERKKSESNSSTQQLLHGDNKAKSYRAQIFSSWLIEKYGQEFLEGGVLDIAGGKGRLSIELALKGKIPCTIIDPLVRKHGSKLNPRQAKKIKKVKAPHPVLISKEFNQNFTDENAELLNKSRILIGLHPDEPTEDILDLALKEDKAVAVVPCCVFSGFFPFRTLPCGTFVQSYDQFLKYLLAKDNRLVLETLPFEGRNKVIYLPRSS
jgi:hypothetical protein